MIGYVLLVTIGIVMSVIVYNYLKSYVPKDLLDCPDGVSILVNNYTCQDGILRVTLKNNGKFNYAGYFIKGANDPGAEMATINLANDFIGTTGKEAARKIIDSYVAFSIEDNDFMKPQMEVTHLFNLSSSDFFLLEITPVRYERVGNKDRFVSCGRAKTVEKISC